MRRFILSVSADGLSAPLRDTVLAHAGYGVIPVRTVKEALKVLTTRPVSVLVMGISLKEAERKRLSAAAKERGIPSVVLDRSEYGTDSASEVHVNPLDGPEAFLSAVAAVLRGVGSAK